MNIPIQLTKSAIYKNILFNENFKKMLKNNDIFSIENINAVISHYKLRNSPDEQKFTYWIYTLITEIGLIKVKKDKTGKCYSNARDLEYEKIYSEYDFNKSLPLDFRMMIDGKPIVIEYNGPQHYMLMEYFKTCGVGVYTSLLWNIIKDCKKWKYFNKHGFIAVVPWFLGGCGIQSFPYKLRYVLSRFDDSGLKLFEQKFEKIPTVFVPFNININKFITEDDRKYENVISENEIKRIMSGGKFTDITIDVTLSEELNLYQSTLVDVDLKKYYNEAFKMIDSLYYSFSIIYKLDVDDFTCSLVSKKSESCKCISWYPIKEIEFVINKKKIYDGYIITKHGELQMFIGLPS